MEKGGYRQSFQLAEGAHQMAYSPEGVRPNDHRNPPQMSAVAPADDIRTIMLNQVSWGAVFAGATIALVMQIILNMVGVGVGLSTIDVAAGDTPSAGSLSVGAGIWWVVATSPGDFQESHPNRQPPIMG